MDKVIKAVLALIIATVAPVAMQAQGRVVKFTYSNADLYINKLIKGQITTGPNFEEVISLTENGIQRATAICQDYIRNKSMTPAQNEELSRTYGYCSTLYNKIHAVEHRMDSKIRKAWYSVAMSWKELNDVITKWDIPLNATGDMLNRTPSLPVVAEAVATVIPAPYDDDDDDGYTVSRGIIEQRPLIDEPASQPAAPAPVASSKADRIVEGEILSIADVDRAPVFNNGELDRWVDEHLVYPSSAAAGEGRVVVVFTVTATGEALEPMVVKSTDPVFDEAAINLIYDMPLWIPASKDNTPVNCTYVLALDFKK